MDEKENTTKKNANANLLGVLKPYTIWITLLVVLTILANGLNLLVPKIIANAIDTYTQGNFALRNVVLEFFAVAVVIFILTYLQNVVQTYSSERVARDLRKKISIKISAQDYLYVERVTPGKLLTNLTSDVDAVKTFVSLAIAAMISSAFLIVGASILLIIINWRLALAVLVIMPIVAAIFYIVFSQVQKLFKKSQETIDWLNKVITESILGSALIRILNSQQSEYEKFLKANTQAKEIGFSILRLFASLIPVIGFATNIATLIILVLGGRFVIAGTLTLGEFTAFNNYLLILIFPIIILGFMSTIIAQATASYRRILDVLEAEEKKESGRLKADLRGNIDVKNVCLSFGEKAILKNVSLSVKAGTKTAIIGPTAAGKTQLLYLLSGLLLPTSGAIEYDGKNIDIYDKETFHRQIGIVFQDSIIFNLTLRENIAFSDTVRDKDLEKAIATAELQDLIGSLPQKLDTIVSERGTSLSGGQKQRIMLTRALALNPKVLLLDDFTARLDTATERKILENVHKNYPGITLLSVTQKIAPIEDFDRIILLMEGEVLAEGTHQELLRSCPEYVQIYNSQKSTNEYELHAK
ncbi:putative ABC transporter ATP-binding protein [Methanosarcinales archaeon]|nr:putative ABC transporter ATP-binding protein [Methanosarcinales archaeon]